MPLRRFLTTVLWGTDALGRLAVAKALAPRRPRAVIRQRRAVRHAHLQMASSQDFPG